MLLIEYKPIIKNRKYMNTKIMDTIFNHLQDKEFNMGYSDYTNGYSDILGIHITDCILSMAKRIQSDFIAWFLYIDIYEKD